MSDTKAIALASTLALGPPRSWVDGCRPASAVIPLERVAEAPNDKEAAQ